MALSPIRRAPSFEFAPAELQSLSVPKELALLIQAARSKLAKLVILAELMPTLGVTNEVLTFLAPDVNLAWAHGSHLSVICHRSQVALQAINTTLRHRPFVFHGVFYNLIHYSELVYLRLTKVISR
jgi:hypothetical protein